MTKAEIIEYLYENNVKGDITIEQMAEDLADRKTEPSNSEKPNNCEHITEDGVTCAKYPACDGCLDNPLNKVKGSERLVKGSEQTEPTISKMEQVDKDINVRSKWETPPKFEHKGITTTCVNVMASKLEYEVKHPSCETCRYDEPNNPKCDECIVGKDKPSNYEPQTDCPWK